MIRLSWTICKFSLDYESWHILYTREGWGENASRVQNTPISVFRKSATTSHIPCVLLRWLHRRITQDWDESRRVQRKNSLVTLKVRGDKVMLVKICQEKVMFKFFRKVEWSREKTRDHDSIKIMIQSREIYEKNKLKSNKIQR